MSVTLDEQPSTADDPAPSAPATSAPASPTATRTPGATSADESYPEQAHGARAEDVLARLPVKGRAPKTGYDRARFGQAWLDADRNGCDTRNDLLGERLTDLVLRPGPRDCVVESGTLVDAYTATTIAFVRGDGTLVDIDHVVALADAWVTGASSWDIRKRAAMANDPLNLEPVDASANRQKGASNAASWLPPNKSYRCTYVARQVAVKAKYGLWMTEPERAALAKVLTICPDQRLPKDSGAPTSVTQNIRDHYDEPAPASATPAPPSGGSVYYENCDAVRAAGAAPVRRGQPGYASHLDREGDGLACE